MKKILCILPFVILIYSLGFAYTIHYSAIKSEAGLFNNHFIDYDYYAFDMKQIQNQQNERNRHRNRNGGHGRYGGITDCPGYTGNIFEGESSQNQIIPNPEPSTNILLLFGILVFIGINRYKSEK